MPITEVTVYRAVCDHEECTVDLGAHMDYEPYFRSPGEALFAATEDGNWDVDLEEQRLLCEQHARPICDACAEYRDPSDLTTVNGDERWCSECMRDAEPAEPQAV